MNIAVFLPNWVGDAVMATPAVRALRERYPGARLIGIVKPYVADVFQGCEWFDALIRIRGRRWQETTAAVALRLRRIGVDLAVLFPNSFRSALMAWLGGCQRRIGYSRNARAALLTDALAPLYGEDGRLKPSPVLDAYNRLAEAAGCPAPGRRMELFTTPADEQAADRVWRSAGLDRYAEVVCLNPGGAFGSAKHWPAEYFAAFARDLAERRGAGVLVLCGPAERESARAIAAGAGHPAVHAVAAPAAPPRVDQGLRPPRRPARDHGQRPAALRGRVRPTGGHAVRPDVHRLDRDLLPAGRPPSTKGGLRALSTTRLPPGSPLHDATPAR
jgi:heptosyltransferase-2